MDDGSVKSSQSKGVYFNTQSFSMSDVDRLCTVLQTKFNIDAVSKNEKIEIFSFFGMRPFLSFFTEQRSEKKREKTENKFFKENLNNFFFNVIGILFSGKEITFQQTPFLVM